MTNNVYEIVTNKIIEKLEQGTVPWQKPWINGNVAVNWKTQKPYRGINTMLLDSGEYLTFKQVQEAKGKIKKRSKIRNCGLLEVVRKRRQSIWGC
ncbi:ArdC-like ssDNA-binding domain-containing protein [Bacillus cereus]